MKNKYEKAIDYFYRKMERGLIEDDEQQINYELAIDALTIVNDNENKKEAIR